MDENDSWPMIISNKGVAKKIISYMGLFPFPFILYTFSPTYCIHSVTTLILHMRRCHLRDHLQKLNLVGPTMAPLFFFSFLCSDYSPWKRCSCLLLFSITFLLLSVPLLCVPTLTVLGCLLSYYTRYTLHRSLPLFDMWKPRCPMIQSAWILAVRGIPEAQFLLNSICLSESGKFVLSLHSQQPA